MNDIAVAEGRPAREATSGASDRRRPRRVAYNNAELIKLLRDPASRETGSVTDLPCTAGAAEPDSVIELDNNGLRAATGILLGISLSLGCWIIIGAAVWLFKT